MKLRYFAGLALAALLATGAPAFAHDGRGGGGGRAAAFQGGGGGRSFAAVRSGGARTFRSGSFSTGRSFQSGGSFAFGGTRRDFRDSGDHRGRFFNGGYYYGGPYFGYDYYPDYDYGYDAPVYNYGDNSGSVSVQVQQALAQEGYYQGQIDGVVGPQTRAAIAAYQRDNGLPVTGAIDGNLLQSLGAD